MADLEKKAKGQWHFVKNGDLPKDKQLILCLTEVEPVICRYDENLNMFFRLSEELEYKLWVASVYAWQPLPTIPREVIEQKNYRTQKNFCFCAEKCGGIQWT